MSEDTMKFNIYVRFTDDTYTTIPYTGPTDGAKRKLEGMAKLNNVASASLWKRNSTNGTETLVARK